MLWFLNRKHQKGHSSITVANEFIRLGKREKIFFTINQLMAFIYIVHGFVLGRYNRLLIFDDIITWKSGPVIPALFFIIIKSRKNSRSYFIKNFKIRYLIKNSQLTKLDIDSSLLIESVYDTYKRTKESNLLGLLMITGSPYDLTVKNLVTFQ